MWVGCLEILCGMGVRSLSAMHIADCHTLMLPPLLRGSETERPNRRRPSGSSTPSIRRPNSSCNPTLKPIAPTTRHYCVFPVGNRIKYALMVATTVPSVRAVITFRPNLGHPRWPNRGRGVPHVVVGDPGQREGKMSGVSQRANIKRSNGEVHMGR